MHKMVNGEQIELTKDEQDALEAEWAANAIIVEAQINNREIYEKLEEIDKKSIRALRSEDKVRLSQLEAQASELRAKLIPIE